MKWTAEEIATRLASAPEDAVCLVRIEDGDYGCEEPPEEPLLWLQAVDAAGQSLIVELPERQVEALGLTEGGICRRSDLQPHSQPLQGSRAEKRP